MDLSTEFLDALHAAGYRLPAGRSIQADDKWNRLLYNDEKISSGRYSLKLLDNGFAIGSFGSDKDPAGFHKWHSKAKSEQPLSREERAQIRAANEAYKAERDRALAVRQEKIGRWLARVVAKMPPAPAAHPYLKNKAVQTHGLLHRLKGNELVVPMYLATGVLANIQRIPANGWKGFWKGARVLGTCYPLGVLEEPDGWLLICEGIATGAAIFEATGLPVRVAFNTGNLKHLAVALREKYPHARIAFAADNDRWTFKAGKAKETPGKIQGDDPRWEEWREAGLLYNPGRDKADEAAIAIGGAIVLPPEFSEIDLAGKPTDWNDAGRIYGQEHVKTKFNEALRVAAVIPAATLGKALTTGIRESSLETDVQAGGGGEYSDYDLEDTHERHGDLGFSFRVLGYNNGMFYYFPFASRQIVALTASGHTMQNLLQLDTLHAWERKWRGSDGKMTAKHHTISLYSSDAMMSLAKKRGVFKEEDRVRGCGTWIDDGRVVMHCGDSLFVDGQRMAFEELRSHYTYVAAVRLLVPSEYPLSNAESAQLRKLCEMPTWENPLSGSLLAGWLVIAPVCAALGYRPHIYITGEAESGKSTVMEKIVKAALGRFALMVDGKTSEPSVREQMGSDARPLIFDEAEPSASIGDVIGLARLASTGGIVKKFGQPIFNARFCACFSAINPPVSKTADESRISFMVLKKNKKKSAIEDFDQLLDMIERTMTPDFSNRLVARTLANMDTLLANIRTFQRAARIITGAARASQQIGTMLAGLYLLGRTDEVTLERAQEWISKHEWQDHTVIDQQGDPTRLIQHVASSLIKTGPGNLEVSVGDLIGLVHAERDGAAQKALRYHGITVKDGRVYIASTSHNLGRLLRDTEWQIKWSRTLGDIPGAQKEKSVYFARGVRTSAVSLPVSLFLETDDDEPRMNFEPDYEEDYYPDRGEPYIDDREIPS